MTVRKQISDAELHAYVDGQLDETSRKHVEGWLVDNPADAERIAQWSAQMGDIRTAFADVLEEPVPAHLIAATNGSSGTWSKLAIATSLVMAFALGNLISPLLKPANETGNTLAVAGLESYFLYTPEKLHPVEVTADNLPHLQTWLTNRVGLPVEAPDLAHSGLKLLGGRLANAKGETAALLMYEGTSGERYTVMIMRADKAPFAKDGVAEKAGVKSLGWTQADYRFVLSGPAEADLLETLKDRIGNPV